MQAVAQLAREASHVRVLCGDQDLWYAVRQSATGPFGPRAKLIDLNTQADDLEASEELVEMQVRAFNERSVAQVHEEIFPHFGLG